MFDKYTKLVLFEYEKKLKSNALSLQWTEPTSAKIKEECFIVCNERFSRKDGNVLKAFFKQGNDKGEVLRAIKKCNPDIFKPLLNYLNKKTGKTAEKNIELLAWLIDFKRRPYQYEENYDISFLEDDEKNLDINKENSRAGETSSTIHKPYSAGENEPEETIPEEISADNPFPNTNTGSDETTLTNPLPASDNLDTSAQLSKYEELKPSSPFVKFRLKYLIFSALLVFVVFTGFLVYRNFDRTSNQQLNTAPPTGSGCMEWIDDHYEQVPCSSKPNGRHVIAVDPQKLKYFRKINKPDTLTMDDIGKVWYIKLNGKMEFYTAEGFHPLDMNRRLRPISAYIIDKYILSEKKQ